MKKHISILFLFAIAGHFTLAQPTQKPIIYGQHWMAITGKPLAATAGSMIFQQGGNAVDAACAMIAATCTMWDVLSWGGETQALIYNPNTGKVIAVNALGMAPTGATAKFFKDRGLDYPPEYGPLAAVTPGTPGGICTILAEFGTMSLKDVLAPAIQMAEGYPMEPQTAGFIEQYKDSLRNWPYSKDIFLVREGDKGPAAGEIFRQKDLFETLTKMVEAEQQALQKGRSRKEAIYAAYDRFYKGDIAEEFTRGCREQGGLITMEDMAGWKVMLEEPLSIRYKGIEVYKLQPWTQGPVMLQALNILENFDLRSMGYNSSRYMNILYQAMNMAFADRDFYYGDPYPFEGKTNPYQKYLEHWGNAGNSSHNLVLTDQYLGHVWAGTTSVQAADAEGWVVSVTPSGGWLPACIAGRTGIGMSQRMQSFVCDSALNPFNVLEPGKRPRVTLTPSIAMKDGRPLYCFGVQGGDTQDQNLLQFFLNMTEFGMNVQEATEAANINTYQYYLSLGNQDRVPRPGIMLVNSSTPPWTQKELKEMGYTLRFSDRTSGPITAIYFDHEHGTLWGGASNYEDDYGIGW
jgi:gamma-glutamyltranspeptidase/glutathione hydrolase